MKKKMIFTLNIFQLEKLPKKNYKTINKDNPFQILKQLNLK